MNDACLRVQIFIIHSQFNNLQKISGFVMLIGFLKSRSNVNLCESVIRSVPVMSCIVLTRILYVKCIRIFVVLHQLVWESELFDHLYCNTELLSPLWLLYIHWSHCWCYLHFLEIWRWKPMQDPYVSFVSCDFVKYLREDFQLMMFAKEAWKKHIVCVLLESDF